MAKKKKFKSTLRQKRILLGIILTPIIFFVLFPLFGIYDKEKATQAPIDDSVKFDYSGTTVKDTGAIYQIDYSRLGTGFSYQIPLYTNMEVDSSNPEDLPNLKSQNVMPYTGSTIKFDYVDMDMKVPSLEGGQLDIVSQKSILVDGKSAQYIEAVRDYLESGYDGYGSYTYHVYVIVDNVMQAERFSSDRVEITSKKFVILASTGDTSDKRAGEEIVKRINEIIPTIRFKEN